MVLADWLQGEPRARLASDIRILASDVDTNVLDHARRGLYSTESLQPIPSHFRDRYFSRSGKDWQIKPSLQEMIAFKRFNLMHEFPFKHGFDVIFCRNVLIYFNREDRVAIVNKFNSCLRPAGYLILGHSESLIAENCGFRSLGNTIYQKL
jgi:chemotaxis protein methyltransferase CheR